MIIQTLKLINGMKKLFILSSLALAVCVVSCQKSGYRITGSATGAEDGDTVILADVSGMFDVDTLQVTVIKDGSFTFKGEQPEPAMRYVIWRSNSNADVTIATQVALENADITIRLDTAENAVAEVGGTPANEALTAMGRKELDINERAQPIFALLSDTSATDAQRSEAETSINALQEEMTALYRDFISANIGNIAGQTYLANYAPMLEDDFVTEQLAALPTDLKSEAIDNLREQYEVKAKTAVGKPFIDINASTPEGTSLSVSDVAKSAKVLMIDFWASWCGPCRAEMPHVKKAYDQFHAQGFDVIGVSLDSDAEAWKKAIADLGLTWHHISDLKGWECEGAAAYGVRSIPASVLVKDGVIVARDLRGEELAAKVKELLGE